jgi:hypothetical protein
MFDKQVLQTFLGDLRREVVAELPDARIEEDFAQLQRAWERLDAERLRPARGDRAAAALRTRRTSVRDVVARGHAPDGRGTGAR